MKKRRLLSLDAAATMAHVAHCPKWISRYEEAGEKRRIFNFPSLVWPSFFFTNHKKMPTSEAEAEDDDDEADAPLLCDDVDDFHEAIVTRLIPTDGRRLGESTGRGRCCGLSFALVSLAWLGLFASGWSTFSCDLVAVQYPTGGVHLTVRAVGIWSFQKEVSGDPKSSNGSAGGSMVCVDYGAIDLKLKNILPSSKALQVCSIVACSFYLAAFLGLVIFLLVLLMHPEALNRKDGMIYSSPGVIANMAATSAAFFFTAAGTIHMTTLHGLIHYNDTSTDDQSTICNPAYSHCYIGPGGSWAVFAIVSAFVCGFVLLLAGYYSRCKRGGASDLAEDDITVYPSL